MPAMFDAAFSKVKALVADFWANENCPMILSSILGNNPFMDTL
jgi:hypothetical protein